MIKDFIGSLSQTSGQHIKQVRPVPQRIESQRLAETNDAVKAASVTLAG